LAVRYADSAVFLEQNVYAPIGNRYSRFWAAYTGGNVAYLPLVITDSGHQILTGNQSDFTTAFQKLVEPELVRPAQADIEAYARPVGARMRVYARLRNLSGATLSAANSATLHALVYEDRHVGDTGRIVRAAPWLGIASAVAPGGESTATLETDDLADVNWDALHTVVAADYVPGPGQAYDLLQAAVAQPAGLALDPQTIPVGIDANHPEDRRVSLRLDGPYVLHWSAASDTPWLVVTPESGGIADQPNVSVAARGVTSTTQEGHVTFSATSDDGMAFTQTATVRAVVGARVLRVGNGNGPPGTSVTLPVELAALGDENAVSFDLAFNPAALQAPTVTVGANADTAVFITDASQVAAGRLGVRITLPAQETFALGVRQLALVSFTVAANVTAAGSTVAFTDQPLPALLADAAGDPLTVTYQAGTVAHPGALAARTPQRHFRDPSP